MDSHNPYPFRSTSRVMRQQVLLAWGQRGVGTKIAAIVIALALLLFLIFVAIPLGIVLTVTVLLWVGLRTLVSRMRTALGLHSKRDAQGRRNVRVIDRLH